MTISKQRGAPLEERFKAKLEVMPSGCIEFRGYCHSTRGYGQIGIGAHGLIETHRLAWTLANGPIPSGMYVCHTCDNPPCCNPEHLFLGTPKDNSDDKCRKGRAAREFMLPHTKISDDQVRAIRARYNPSYGPPKRGGRRSNAPELAEEFGITPDYVMQIARRAYRKSVV